MKARILCGAATALAAVGLVLAGAAPAAAKHHHHHHKQKSEKHSCGGKNGCHVKTEDKGATAPAPAQPANDAK
jgi:hypothetical protein